MNQSHLRNLSLVAGLAAVGGLAFFVGRLSVDETSGTLAGATAPGAPGASPAARPRRVEAPARRVRDLVPAPREAGPAAAAGSALDAPELDAASIDPTSLDPTISDLRTPIFDLRSPTNA